MGLEGSRTTTLALRPAHALRRPGARRAPAAGRRAAFFFFALLVCALTLASLAFEALTRRLPFSFQEIAVLGSGSRLGPLGRLIVSLVGTQDVFAWRIAGAVSLALAALGGGAVVRRLAASASAGACASLLVFTHAAALLAASDVEGSVLLLGTATALFGAWLACGTRATAILGLFAGAAAACIHPLSAVHWIWLAITPAADRGAAATSRRARVMLVLLAAAAVTLIMISSSEAEGGSQADLARQVGARTINRGVDSSTASLLAGAAAGLLLAWLGRRPRPDGRRSGPVPSALLGIAVLGCLPLLMIGLGAAPARFADLVAPFAIVLMMGLAAGVANTSGSARFVAIVCCIVFSTLGAGAAASALSSQAPDRIALERFLARLDANRKAPALEVVLDAPVPTSQRYGRAASLAALRPGRQISAYLPPENAAFDRILVQRWSAPAEEGFLSAMPPDLAPVLDAVKDPAIKLLSPSPGAVLRLGTAEQEPHFNFSLPPEDEAHAEHTHAHPLIVLIAQLPGDRHQVTVRELDDSILRREQSPSGETLTWRPSWRSMEHGDREIRWEDGEVCQPGHALHWTVLVPSPEGPARIAPFRRHAIER